MRRLESATSDAVSTNMKLVHNSVRFMRALALYAQAEEISRGEMRLTEEEKTDTRR